MERNARYLRRPMGKKSLKNPRSQRLRLREPEGRTEPKEKVMQQYSPLFRKDNQPVRYLVVDDSVFARKNIIKMIELFGGELAGEAGDGLTATGEDTPIRRDIDRMDSPMPQM